MRKFSVSICSNSLMEKKNLNDLLKLCCCCFSHFLNRYIIMQQNLLVWDTIFLLLYLSYNSPYHHFIVKICSKFLKISTLFLSPKNDDFALFKIFLRNFIFILWHSHNANPLSLQIITEFAWRHHCKGRFASDIDCLLLLSFLLLPSLKTLKQILFYLICRNTSICKINFF